MSVKRQCDLCKRIIMENYSDTAYKVTVKKLSHAYDGYAPWVGSNRLDVCPVCITKIVNSTQGIKL